MTRQKASGLQLGAVLTYAREQLGLSRGQLARQMGYKNLGRGGQQLQRWESSCRIPPVERVVVLARHLDMPIMDLLNLRDQDLQRQKLEEASWRRLLARGAAGYRADLQLVKTNYEALMTQRRRIVSEPLWAGIALADAGLLLAYLGARPMTLGDLLEAWSQDRMTVRCCDCGGSFRLFRLAGSPLSGRHQIQGFCSQCGQDHQHRLPDRPKLLRFAASLNKKLIDHPAQRPDRGALMDLTDSQAETPWCLSQLLVHLGLEAPDLHLEDRGGRPLARYSPKTAELWLEGAQTPICFQLLFDRQGPGWDQPLTFLMEDWGEANSSGPLVLGQINPPRAGSWRGQSRHIYTADGSEEWHQSRGLLYDPGGRVRMVCDGSLPPPVLIWITGWLARGGDRQ